MRLTKKKAIELSIELWTWLAETGERYKKKWPEWNKYPHAILYCFLCEYDDRANKRKEWDYCSKCPYYINYDYLCDDDDKPFDNWTTAGDKEGRKKYAKQFLEQLKELNNAK